MHIGQRHIHIFPFGWFLICLSTLAVLGLLSLAAWFYFRN